MMTKFGMLIPRGERDIALKGQRGNSFDALARDISIPMSMRSTVGLKVRFCSLQPQTCRSAYGQSRSFRNACPNGFC